MVIGTAKYVKKPCRDALDKKTPFEVRTKAKKPITNMTESEASVIRFLKNIGSLTFFLAI
jgi:hypothetical protein